MSAGDDAHQIKKKGSQSSNPTHYQSHMGCSDCWCCRWRWCCSCWRSQFRRPFYLHVILKEPSGFSHCIWCSSKIGSDLFLYKIDRSQQADSFRMKNRVSTCLGYRRDQNSPPSGNNHCTVHILAHSTNHGNCHSSQHQQLMWTRAGTNHQCQQQDSCHKSLGNMPSQHQHNVCCCTVLLHRFPYSPPIAAVQGTGFPSADRPVDAPSLHSGCFPFVTQALIQQVFVSMPVRLVPLRTLPYPSIPQPPRPHEFCNSRLASLRNRQR